MGRRRAGGAEPLPQAVRRNNAKNERKTMEAMADTLWSSVESGRERRLRLAAEKLCRVYAEQGTTPAQKQEEVSATDQATTVQEQARQVEEAETVLDRVESTEAPVVLDKVAEKAVAQEMPVEDEQETNTQAAESMTQQSTSTVVETAIAESVSPPEETVHEATTNKEADASEIQQNVSEVLTTPEGVGEFRDIQEPVMPDEMKLAEAAVPTEEADVPERSEEVCMSSWEMVEAPVQDQKTGGIELFEVDAGLLMGGRPNEESVPDYQASDVIPVKQDNAEAVAETFDTAELTETSAPEVDGESFPTAQGVFQTEEPIDDSGSTSKTAVVAEISKCSPINENGHAAPLAEAADIGISGKEADLPIVSQSHVMTEPVDSSEAPQAHESVETAVAEQACEVADTRHDTKKKKKKGKRGGEQTKEPAAEQSTPVLDDQPGVDGEQSQQTKGGKKHKRHKDKRKKTQSESSEKDATIENQKEETSVHSEQASKTSTDSVTTTEITKTSEANESIDTSEPVMPVETVEPVEEQWTTVETKKTKRKRRKSERKSESEDKVRVDNQQDNEQPRDVKEASNHIVEDMPVANVIETTGDNASNAGQDTETQKNTGGTLSDFDRLLSSVGDLKEKIRQASEVKTEEAKTPAETETESVETGKKTTEPSSAEPENPPDLPKESIPSEATQGTVDSPDAFDLLLSSGDGLEEGFNEAFSAEDPVGEDRKESGVDTHDKTEQPSDINLITPSPEQQEAVQSKVDVVPDAFDLLISADDDLAAGFRDAFGDEEASDLTFDDGEIPLDTESAHAPLKTVEADESESFAVQHWEAPKSENEPTKNEEVKQDAFDLLLSTSDDLQEGFKEAFASEDQITKESERQQEVNDQTVVETTPISLENESQRQEPGDASNSLPQETRSVPDAFDLLMSADDGDLEAGFKDAFGEEEHDELKLGDETKEVFQTPEETVAVTSSTAADIDSSSQEKIETSKSEDKMAVNAEPAIDAFDILMFAGDGLHEGFEESFGVEEEDPEPTKPTNTSEITAATQSELVEEKLQDDVVTSTTNSVEPDLPLATDVPAAEFDQTIDETPPKDEDNPEKTTPSMSPASEWFDKTMHDAAETKYHEQISSKQLVHADEAETGAIESTTVESVQEPQQTGSSAEEDANVQAPSKSSSQPIIDESAWYDKMLHDSAETRYYERLSKSQMSEKCPEAESLPTEATCPTASLPVTIESDSPSETKADVTMDQTETEKPSPESLLKLNVAAAESTWYDKVTHDEAEARHYERLCRKQHIESSDKKAQTSQEKADEPLQAVLSSEQTWFDKPFHDSAETVRHVRQSSNDSDNSNKSVGLYEGKCDHFKTDDQQTPEENADVCCEVETHDSWTENKLYNVADKPSSSSKSVEEKTTDSANTSSAQIDKVSISVDAPIATQITVNTEDNAEPPRSPTSDGFRSRHSTFNSVASPLSPQTELEDYFEDVVLAGRQSDVTMAALRGFTASPLSEGLAPGEQLDSLRTEPDLDLSEPGTADTLDDGPFSYQDIGDDGTATPVGDAPASATIQSLMPEVKLPSVQPEVTEKEKLLWSKPDDSGKVDTVEAVTPVVEVKREPSPLPEGGDIEYFKETSMTAPTTSSDPSTMSLGEEKSETTTSEVPKPETDDILAQGTTVNAECDIPSATPSQEVIPTAQSLGDADKTEEHSPVMTSTPLKSDTEASAIPQASEGDLPPEADSTTPEQSVSREKNQAPTDGTNEPSDIFKEAESQSKEINEKLGLNEDGTVPTQEPDEEVVMFTVQGAPRSPVATRRSSRKKKMRSGGRKSSSESIDSQPRRDSHTAPVQDESTRSNTESSAADAGTKDDCSVPQSDVTLEVQASTIIPDSEQANVKLASVIATDETVVTDVKEETQSSQPDGDSMQPAQDTPLVESTISVLPEDSGSPPQEQTQTLNGHDTIEEVTDIDVCPPETYPKSEELKTPSQTDIHINVEGKQPEASEAEEASKADTIVGTSQIETVQSDREIKIKDEIPVSSTEIRPEQSESENSVLIKPDADTIVTCVQAKQESELESVVSYQEKKLSGNSEAITFETPQQLTQVEKPKVSDSAETKPEQKSSKKSKKANGSSGTSPKPEPVQPVDTGKSIPISLPSEAKPSDQKPASKAPPSSLPILPDRTLFLPEDEGRTYASLMQQGADMKPARAVFTAHACHVCKRLHTKQHRLKSCGSCRLVAYCSAEHQRAHWPLHRALCKVITRRVRHLGTDHIYREALNVSSPEQWKKIRFKHMQVCEEMLGRPMEPYEKEMFLYPRACDTCHETNPEKLHTCANCHSVSFCSVDHLRKNHSKYCKDLRTLLDIHSYQNAHGVCEPPLPETVLTEYEHLPPHIRELLVVSLLGPHRAMELGPVPLTVLTDYASYPLTLLYALQNIPIAEEAHISQLTELTVHVVGAEHATDCHPLSRWDSFLLHLLPRLRRLHVVFIGNELEAAGGRPGVTQRDFTCAACREAGRRLTCELQPSTDYHTYCRSPQFRPPNVIAAFNAGVHRFAGHATRDTWRDTIPYLVREGVPLILSGYTLLECPQDVARIQQEQKVDILLPPRKNPYRSTRPQQNFLNEHEAPVVFKNQYVACLTAAAKPRK